MSNMQRHDGAAGISDCENYRYWLTREWGHPHDCDPNTLVWIMLNPSTADGLSDDPTIRKCIGFARQWGYRGFRVINLFAFRATHPRELLSAIDPIGGGHQECQYALIASTAKVVVAWGANGTLRRRGADVVDRLTRRGLTLHCLGRTANGQPRHPLMLPYSTPLEIYAPSIEEGKL